MDLENRIHGIAGTDPANQRHGERRQDGSLLGGDFGQVIRAIYVPHNPEYGSFGRDDSAGDMQLQTQTSHSREGERCQAGLINGGKAALGQPGQRRPAISPIAGARGKYGGIFYL